MNFDELLAAISDTAPCGDDLSFSPEFDAIQELRRADDPTLDQGAWVTALKSADWAGVLAQCEQVLGRRTKDLRVAGWLADANARLNGYAGLADGLALCNLLCERYWDDLYPRIEQDDLEERAGNLRWLLVQIEALVPQLTVLRHGARAFSLRDIESAQLLARSTTGRPGDAAGGPAGVTQDEIAAARRGTPRAFYAANLADVRQAAAALDRLQQSIDARMGADGPGFSRARIALEGALHAVDRLARDAGATGDPAGAADQGLDDAGDTGNAGDAGNAEGRAADSSAATTAAAAGSSGPLRSRADALQQLRAVADFFRRTEPHSPVAYLADRAARWGEMPLHTWLRAVLKDDATLSQMEELLGVEPLPPPSSE